MRALRAVRVATASVAILLLTAGVACSSDDGESTASMGREMTPSSGAGGKEAANDEVFTRLDPAAFAERMQDENAVVINVHVPYEGELEQTDAFIPYDKILDDPKLPQAKDSEILLYCRTGHMSEEAANALHQAGYTNLAHLQGGMKAWEAAGHQLIQNPAHAA